MICFFITNDETFQVEEGGTVALSLSNIRATDMDSSVGHLMVLVQTGPSFGRLVSTKAGK